MKVSVGRQDRDRPAFSMVEGYMIASVLASLELIGLLERLEGKGLLLEESGTGDQASALLQAALDYLLQRGLIECREGRLTMTPFGVDVCADKGYLLWLSGGYGAPLHELHAFWQGSARYGEESVRDGRCVARGSALLGARDVVPEAMEMLSEISFGRVLDLGCGNGRFLISLCDRFGCEGLGIDISPEACEEARQAVTAAGLGRRVGIKLGDAADLADVPLEHTQLVIAFFLLHELSSISRATLVGLLRGMTARLPAGAHLLAAEVEPATRRYLDNVQFTPEFTFVHAMMRQKLLPEDDWRELLTDGGFEVESIIRPRQPGGLLLLSRTPVP